MEDQSCESPKKHDESGNICSNVICTLFKYDKSLLDLVGVLEYLKNLFANLECDMDDWHLPARMLVIEKNMFKCKDHEDVYSEGNMKMLAFWQQTEKMLKSIEQEMVRLEAVLAFVNTDNVKSEFEPEKLQKMAKLRHGIIEMLSELEQSSYALSTEATYEDFQYLQNCQESITSMKEQIYSEISPQLLSVFEKRLLTNMMGKSQQDIL